MFGRNIWQRNILMKRIFPSFHIVHQKAIVGMKNGDIDAVWSSGALKDKFKNKR